jgi:hypothetical protein
MTLGSARQSARALHFMCTLWMGELPSHMRHAYADNDKHALQPMVLVLLFVFVSESMPKSCMHLAARPRPAVARVPDLRFRRV